MALVEVARFDNRVEADLARLVLEADGISVELFDVGMNYIGLGPIMPIRMMVPEEQSEAAVEILGEEGLA